MAGLGASLEKELVGVMLRPASRRAARLTGIAQSAKLELVYTLAAGRSRSRSAACPFAANRLRPPNPPRRSSKEFAATHWAPHRGGQGGGALNFLLR